MGVKSLVRKAGKAAMKVVGAETDDDDQDILATLGTEHDQVKSLLSELVAADTAGRRRALVREIKAALLPHTKAEQAVLYTALIATRDKDAQVDGEEGNIEHDLAAKTLQKLDGLSSPTSSEHKAAAKVLKELVEHHIREEERNVWSDAKKHFSGEERIAMNRRYLARKARVRLS